MCIHSFSASVADELGLHAAIIYNHILYIGSASCNIPRGYLLAAVSGYMTESELDKAISTLGGENLISISSTNGRIYLVEDGE